MRRTRGSAQKPVACPVCGRSFSAKAIAGHADRCAQRAPVHQVAGDEIPGEGIDSVGVWSASLSVPSGESILTCVNSGDGDDAAYIEELPEPCAKRRRSRLAEAERQGTSFMTKLPASKYLIARENFKTITHRRHVRALRERREKDAAFAEEQSQRERRERREQRERRRKPAVPKKLDRSVAMAPVAAATAPRAARRAATRAGRRRSPTPQQSAGSSVTPDDPLPSAAVATARAPPAERTPAPDGVLEGPEDTAAVVSAEEDGPMDPADAAAGVAAVSRRRRDREADAAEVRVPEVGGLAAFAGKGLDAAAAAAKDLWEGALDVGDGHIFGRGADAAHPFAPPMAIGAAERAVPSVPFVERGAYHAAGPALGGAAPGHLGARAQCSGGPFAPPSYGDAEREPLPLPLPPRAPPYRYATYLVPHVYRLQDPRGSYQDHFYTRHARAPYAVQAYAAAYLPQPQEQYHRAVAAGYRPAPAVAHYAARVPGYHEALLAGARGYHEAAAGRARWRGQGAGEAQARYLHGRTPAANRKYEAGQRGAGHGGDGGRGCARERSFRRPQIRGSEAPKMSMNAQSVELLRDAHMLLAEISRVLCDRPAVFKELLACILRPIRDASPATRTEEIAGTVLRKLQVLCPDDARLLSRAKAFLYRSCKAQPAEKEEEEAQRYFERRGVAARRFGGGEG